MDQDPVLQPPVESSSLHCQIESAPMQTERQAQAPHMPQTTEGNYYLTNCYLCSNLQMFLLQTTFLHVLALGALAQCPTQSTFSSRGLCKHCTRCTECRLQSQGVHILQFHCCQWVPPTQRHRVAFAVAPCRGRGSSRGKCLLILLNN